MMVYYLKIVKNKENSPQYFTPATNLVKRPQVRPITLISIHALSSL